jgi:phospholipid-binding lipoprotein MlaA
MRRATPWLRPALAAAALLAAGCASGPPEDPWASFNRPVFRFNDAADTYVLRPVARGWTFVTFEELRKSVKRFFYNSAFPTRFVSSLGQGEGQKAADEAGRFLLNTTIGVVGLFDPATHVGFPRHDEDIGQMFGRWGVPPGPYLVLPLMGPSNPRDAVGMAVDFALNPLLWIDVPVYGLGALNVVNSRALADDEIQRAKATALDYYVFVRDAYVQNRAAAVADQEQTSPAKGSAPFDDLYDLPDEE